MGALEDRETPLSQLHSISGIEERGVRAAAVHPGGIQTELARHMDPAHLEQMVKQINEQAAAEGKRTVPVQNSSPGSRPRQQLAAVVAPAEEVGTTVLRELPRE